MTFSTVKPFDTTAEELETPFEMDEDAFRAFYERTARPLWAYLARITGDRQAADDLLQETYFRFLRARIAHGDDAHRRSYLFRVATNLAHDRYRRRATAPVVEHAELDTRPARTGTAAAADHRLDLSRAFRRLKRRERELLWLAYAEGSSHEEIGAVLGLRTGSIKMLLSRARKHLASLLGRDTSRGGHRA
jgi:RNA polymerase sigma-70 factor (ECF subfamily)